MIEHMIKCCNCGKKISLGEAYLAYNHPEAPPVCFDCLPEEVKESLRKPIPKPKPDNSPTDVNDKDIKVDKPDKGGGG